MNQISNAVKAGPGFFKVLGLLLSLTPLLGSGREAMAHAQSHHRSPRTEDLRPEPVTVSSPGASLIQPSLVHPSPSLSLSPSPLPVIKPLTAAEAALLSKEFQRAQRSEVKALEHRQEFEIRELKASHAARLKEWESDEKTKRHQYFKDHSTGPDRRIYVKDSIQRHEALLSILKEERLRRQHEHEVRRASLKDEQQTKSRQFAEELKKGQRPASQLWPSPGN